MHGHGREPALLARPTVVTHLPSPVLLGQRVWLSAFTVLMTGIAPGHVRLKCLLLDMAVSVQGCSRYGR